MKYNLRIGYFETFLCAIVLSRLISPLSKDKTRRDSSFTLMICPCTSIPWLKPCLCIFV